MNRWDLSERWFAGLLTFLYASGLVAHLIPSLYPLTRYTTDFFLLVINSALLFFVYRRHGDVRLWWWAALTYLGTFAVEALGVATGRIFGVYAYGATMQVQWLGVPLVIALNWTVLTLAVNDLVIHVVRSPWPGALLSGVLIAGYDFFIEPVAIRLDYWQWAGGQIPIRNYVAWAIVAFGFSLPLRLLRIRFQSRLLLLYLAVQWVYFLLLNALL